MNERDRRPPSAAAGARSWLARRVPRRLFWLAIPLVVAGATWLLREVGRDRRPETPDLVVSRDRAAEDEAAGDRAVILVFPEWDAAGYVVERRRIPSRGHPEEDLQAVLDALCSGPTRSGAVGALPAGTRILAVFLDREGREAVLDFSAELVVRHPGGSAAEAATLTSILRTVALNFPEVRSCRILVAGAPAETLNGHLSLDEVFELRRWL
ncbi:MAG TPA: GerMN domain-containing protein [Candidatus Krumholzibacteria bacterium]|nr:GerMN domain-containing protein [Candidatus Krumholzibacteria bacterium]HPD71011.1 GerMN domain-containing protein [Candidatus Krumholzibacteria bacterium]HRY39289.1 GerMN domain-containing protein [Candidatus Krumholzibacteria bacterium]